VSPEIRYLGKYMPLGSPKAFHRFARFARDGLQPEPLADGFWGNRLNQYQ